MTKKTHIHMIMYTHLLICASLLGQQAPEESALRVHVASLEQHALHCMANAWYREGTRAQALPKLSESLVHAITRVYTLKTQAFHHRHSGITPTDCIQHTNADMLHYVLWQTQAGYQHNSPDATETMVTQAAREGNYDCLRSLLGHAKTPDTIINETVLFDAISDNDIETVNILLDHHAAINTKQYPYDETPLHASLRQSRFQIAQRILRNHPDLSLRDTLGQTALHTALKAHAPQEIIKEIIEQKPSTELINSPDNLALTPLHTAAMYHDDSAIAILIQYGATIDPRTDTGYTPLDYAAGHGNSSAARALIHAGAKPVYSPDSECPTALNRTLRALANCQKQELQPAQGSQWQEEQRKEQEKRLLTTAQLFIQECPALFTSPNNTHSILKDTCDCDAAEIIAALHIRGIDMKSAVDDHENTPLHIAAKKQHCATCQALITAEVPVNSQNAAGNTPLHYAQLHNNEQLIHLLLAAGADPEIRNTHGEKPGELHIRTIRCDAPHTTEAAQKRQRI